MQTGKDIMFYLNAFDSMWAISLIIFGIHILLVGYTLPKISNIVFPQYKDIMRTVEAIFLIPMLSEVALGVWLLIIGIKEQIQTK